MSLSGYSFCFIQARELLRKVERRELYKCVGQTQAILHGGLKKVLLGEHMSV